MIVPIETSVSRGRVPAGAAVSPADLSMDLFERDGAYVAEVYLGRCDERSLRVEAQPGEVALVGDCGALMRLRLRDSIDTTAVSALLGNDLLTITMPKRGGSAGSGSDLRGWIR